MIVDKVNETLVNIIKRRSIRHFEDRPVEKWQIDKLLDCAMSAPSAKNLRPVRFIVLGEDVMEKLGATLSQGQVFEQAPAAIAVCADLSDYPEDSMGWLEDCSAALENILIGATSLGLGSLWFGVYRRSPKEEQVRDALEVPSHVEVQGIALVGYSAEVPADRKKNLEGVVHHGRWRS